MDIRECWRQLGGDYDEQVRNMGMERIVLKFAKKYANDRTFQSLEMAVKDGNVADAQMHAHTIKGICLNLGFKNLAQASSEMSEQCKAGCLDLSQFEKVAQYQREVEEVLRQLP